MQALFLETQKGMKTELELLGMTKLDSVRHLRPDLGIVPGAPFPHSAATSEESAEP